MSRIFLILFASTALIACRGCEDPPGSGDESVLRDGSSGDSYQNADAGLSPTPGDSRSSSDASVNNGIDLNEGTGIRESSGDDSPSATMRPSCVDDSCCTLEAEHSISFSPCDDSCKASGTAVDDDGFISADASQEIVIGALGSGDLQTNLDITVLACEDCDDQLELRIDDGDEHQIILAFDMSSRRVSVSDNSEILIRAALESGLFALRIERGAQIILSRDDVEIARANIALPFASWNLSLRASGQRSALRVRELNAKTLRCGRVPVAPMTDALIAGDLRQPALIATEMDFYLAALATDSVIVYRGALDFQHWQYEASIPLPGAVRDLEWVSGAEGPILYALTADGDLYQRNANDIFSFVRATDAVHLAHVASELVLIDDAGGIETTSNIPNLNGISLPSFVNADGTWVIIGETLVRGRKQLALFADDGTQERITNHLLSDLPDGALEVRAPNATMTADGKLVFVFEAFDGVQTSIHASRILLPTSR